MDQCLLNPLDALKIEEDKAICHATFASVMRQGGDVVTCAVCRAVYLTSENGKQCLDCLLGTIGVDAIGFAIKKGIAINND